MWCYLKSCRQWKPLSVRFGKDSGRRHYCLTWYSIQCRCSVQFRCTEEKHSPGIETFNLATSSAFKSDVSRLWRTLRPCRPESNPVGTWRMTEAGTRDWQLADEEKKILNNHMQPVVVVWTTDEAPEGDMLLWQNQALLLLFKRNQCTGLRYIK